MVCCSWRGLCPLTASLNVHIVFISRALLLCPESVHAPWLLCCEDSSSLDSVHLKCQMASAIPAQLFNSWLVSCHRLLLDSKPPAGCPVPDHDHVPDCGHHLHCCGGVGLLSCAEHPGPAAPPLQ